VVDLNGFRVEFGTGTGTTGNPAFGLVDGHHSTNARCSS